MDVVEQVSSPAFSLYIAFIVQATLILFFVVSPIVGMFMHRAIAQTSTLVLVVCVCFLVADVGAFALFFGIRSIADESVIGDVPLGILSIVASGVVGILLGRYISWHYRAGGKPAYLKDVDEMEFLSPVDRRRKQHMKRKKRS